MSNTDIIQRLQYVMKYPLTTNMTKQRMLLEDAISEIERLRGQGDKELSKQLQALSDSATAGVWGQFALQDGPFQELAKADYQKNRDNLYTHDTSHHMSAVNDGEQYRLCEWRHSADAAFAEALVNAFRAGQLKPLPQPPEQL